MLELLRPSSVESHHAFARKRSEPTSTVYSPSLIDSTVPPGPTFFIFTPVALVYLGKIQFKFNPGRRLDFSAERNRSRRAAGNWCGRNLFAKPHGREAA